MIKKVESIVHDLREVVYSVLGKDGLSNKCEEVSVFVNEVFRKHELGTIFVIGSFKHPNGEYHTWNLVEGYPIDLTVSQYGFDLDGIIEKGFYKEYYEIISQEDDEEKPINNKLMEIYIATKRNKIYE